MNIIVVGSTALRFHKPYSNICPNDLDIMGTYEDVNTFLKSYDLVEVYPINQGKKLIARDVNNLIIEAEIAWPGSSTEEFIKLVIENNEYSLMNITKYASLNLLYMLKMSHRYLRNSPHFNKTRLDIKHLENLGCKIPELFKDWFKRREKETYNYGHPKLNQSKKNFFSDDGVEYIYEHDSLHEIVKIGEMPAYKKYAHEDKEILSNMNKFDSLPFYIKLHGVVEEAMVLALERSIIPHPGILTPRQSFLHALMKICTSITSGKFREFAYNNYDTIVNYFEGFNGINDDWYVRQFNNAVDDGRLTKLYSGDKL